MKNFKRVISAVIALALSASTLVAVSASKFADVDGTNYAEAIDVLAALDVIHGYDEEGGLVFKPEGEITRAEAAVMIVGALNMNKDAQAAAGSSKFTDVNEQTAWAQGYVNVGVAQGYINGMDATTFAPQQNVTYAQMCVMLTSILGYKEYAEAYGGWPTGYTTIAASTGINKGVSLSADTPLKRGQVAQMIYSTIKTPVLGVSEYSLQGNKYAPQDGSKGDFKTVLSDKFEGYAVKVKVTATPGNSTLEKGKVDLALTEDAFLDESQLKKTTATTILNDAYADIDMEPYFLQTGDAIVVQDADKKWHIVYFSANDKDSKEYAAADLVDVTYDGTNAVFNFGSGKEIKIPAANFYGTTKLYANNQSITPTLTLTASATIPELKNLIDAAQGNVRFTKNGSNYDGIFVDYYSIASVDAVKYDKNTTTISFSRINGNGGLTVAASGKIIISDEALADGTVEVIVTKNGEAAKLADIAEDDIIAIYAGSLAGDITDTSKSVKIVATDAAETGRLDAVEDDEYTVDGTKYLLTDGVTLPAAITAGTTFTAVLDPFGRIAKTRDQVSSVKYAVVVSYDDDEVTLITKDGSKVTYKFDTAVAANLAGIRAAMKNKIEDRVISYDLRTKTNTITSITNVAATGSTGAGTKLEYKGVAKKVGNILLSDETYIMNAKDAAYTQTVYDNPATTTVDESEYKLDASKISSYAALTDGIEYEAYAWDKPSGTITFGLVIVKGAGTVFDASSRFAVAKSTLGSATVDGDNVFTVEVVGSDARINVATDAKVYDLRTGTGFATITATTAIQGKAFYYTVDTDGYVDAIYVIFDGDAAADATGSVLTNANALGVIKGGTGGDWTNMLFGNPTEDIRLVYGLVSEVGSESVTFVNDTSVTVAGKNMMDTTALEKFNFASDAVKYSYDKNSTTASKKADKISEQGLAKSNFNLFKYESDPSYVWQKLSTDAAAPAIAKAGATDAWTDDANYAIAMIVNEQVVAIYEVIQ